jgi:hypothetical protein
LGIRKLTNSQKLSALNLPPTMNRSRNSSTAALGGNGEHCQISSKRLAKCFSCELNITRLSSAGLGCAKKLKDVHQLWNGPVG